jgi:hypothetical protein
MLKNAIVLGLVLLFSSETKATAIKHVPDTEILNEVNKKIIINNFTNDILKESNKENIQTFSPELPPSPEYYKHLDKSLSPSRIDAPIP